MFSVALAMSKELPAAAGDPQIVAISGQLDAETSLFRAMVMSAEQLKVPLGGRAEWPGDAVVDVGDPAMTAGEHTGAVPGLQEATQPSRGAIGLGAQLLGHQPLLGWGGDEQPHRRPPLLIPLQGWP